MSRNFKEFFVSYTGGLRTHVRTAKSRRRLKREIAEIQRDLDVVIVSYPKSGRTWHRALVGHYVANAHGYPIAESLNTKEMTAKLGLPVVGYSHGGANFSDNVGGLLRSGDDLVGSARFFSGKRIILLVRKPVDVVVSAYHHDVFRTKSFTGSLSEFVKDDRKGIRKIAVAYSRWNNRLTSAADHRVIHYEDMHREPEKILADNLRFIRLDSVDEKAIAAAVQFASFDSMKKMEREGVLAHDSMARAESDEGAKVRRGKVGGYKDYLTPSDIEFVDRVLVEHGRPFGY